MNALVARRLYFSLQYLRGEPVAQALKEVLLWEKLTRQELRELQVQKMKALLLHAGTTVPFYRRSFGHILPALQNATDYESLSQILAAVAPTQKGDVVGREDEFTSSRARRIPTHPNTTSGSTGTPLIFPCDQLSWAFRHALLIRSLRWFGVELGEPYGYFFGLHWRTRSRLSVRLRDWVFNRARVSAYEIRPENILRYYRTLKRKRVTHLIGYPSAIYEYCILAEDQGLDLKGLGLKAVFTTAEPLLPFQRAVIESATASRCVNMYGSVECGFNACECPEGNLHATIETTWFQKTANDDVILLTDLYLRAFPLINYAIGDEIEMAPETEVCRCGREHPLIMRVVGRSGEPIRLPNGRIVNANLPSYIFKPLAHLRCIRKYRFVEDRSGRLRLLLSVTERFKEKHLRLIEQETLKAFGEGIDLEICLVGEIPVLPNAKHRCYVRSGENQAAAKTYRKQVVQREC